MKELRYLYLPIKLLISSEIMISKRWTFLVSNISLESFYNKLFEKIKLISLIKMV